MGAWGPSARKDFGLAWLGSRISLRITVLVANYIFITEKPTDDDPNLLSF